MDFAALLAVVDRSLLTTPAGDDVTYAPSVGDPVQVRGMFDAAYVRVDAGQAGVSSAGPAVFLRLADLPSDPGADSPTITVGGVDYEPHTVEPDGKGGVLLLMHRA